MIKSLLITILLLALLIGFCSLGIETVMKTFAVISGILIFISWWVIIYGIIQIGKKD